MAKFSYSAASRSAKPKFQHYHCSACNGVFKFFHASADSPSPDCCQLCGAVLDDEAVPVFVPQAPGIRKSVLVKSENQVYRQMEAASIARAEEARSAHNLTADQANAIKITNMRELGDMREGDTAAISPPTSTNQVAQLMAQHPGQGGFNAIGENPGAAYRLGHADAGAETHSTLIRPNHARIADRMTRAGMMRPPA